MRLHSIAAAAAALAAGSAQAASVEIRDAVVRVTVIPEARSDIKIEITRPNAKLPLSVRTLGDRTILDGDLDRRIHNCRSFGARPSVSVRGQGDIGWDEMPKVVIRTPRDVSVEAGGAVFGAVGRSASLTLANSGCGDWTIANVAGQARLSQAGSGDARLGSSGGLRIRVAGSGDIAAGDVKGPLDINIAGSGGASVRSISGPLEVSIAGSGDVTVGAGRASDMKVSVAGSGDIEFLGVAERLNARIAGSGDVHVSEVKGEVSKSIVGSGRVNVGN